MVKKEQVKKTVMHIEFRDTPAGSVTSKMIRIKNETLVKQHYEITTDPVTNPLDYVFQVDPWKKCIESGESFNFKLQYTPNMPFTTNFDYFNVFDSEGISFKIVVRGNSIGPAVSTSANKLLFVSSTGKEVHKIVELKNDSTFDAHYQFDVDLSQCMFKPDNMYGTIGPHKYIYIGITFTPPGPGIYTKDLFCLIHYQQPVVIKLEGLSIPEESKLNAKDLNIIRFPQNVPITDPYDCYMAYAIQERENLQSLTLSINYVDFGQTNIGGTHFPHNFSITNNTKKDILLQWDKDLKEVFSIVPQSAVIPSNQFTVFQAFFHPTKMDNFYYIELEGQGYRNDNVITIKKNLNLFQDKEVYMSTCISIRMMGHTFPDGGYGWMPQFKVVPQCIVLPACIPPLPVYTTFIIKRFGHLPVMFKFIPPQETNFFIKPMQGIIMGDYQVVIVQMHPKGKDEKAYIEQWTIQFNGTSQHNTTVEFRAYAEYPNVKTLTEPVNEVNFPPTFLGCEGLVKVPIRNTSRHCIRYKFLCPDSTIKMRNTKEDSNIISANEVIYQTWCITPQIMGIQEVEVKLELVVLRESRYPIGIPVDSIIIAYGLCEHVDIVAFPYLLDLGPSPLEVQKSGIFHVFNFSSCPIYFKLACIHRNIVMEHCSTDIEIRKMCDTLAPNSKMEVAIDLCPLNLGVQELAITYQIRINNWSNELTADLPLPIIHIDYEGILPTLKVLELKYESSETLFSKVCYWNCMNINGLNETLATILPNEERTVVMNFPEAPVNSAPLTIYLYLKTNGDFPVIWNVKRHQTCSCKLIRKDLGISLIHKVFECPHRAIFTISKPSVTTLQQHETQVLKLVVQYDMEGSWDLVYFIELSNNRKININAHVVAFPNNIPVVSTFTPALSLKNVFIGEMESTSQMYWLYNNSNEDAEYDVNTAPMMHLAMCQYNINVLKCWNPIGTIKAKTVHPIIFSFNPIEIRNYEILLPIQLSEQLPQMNLKVTGDGVVGFDDHVRTMHHKLSNPTCVNTFEIPLVFSMDHIIIESPFPIHSKTERIFFIENQTNHIYGYTWKDYHLDTILRATVTPSKGILQPLESHLCKLTVKSGNNPILTTVRIHLEALNMTERRNHDKSVIMHLETERQLEGQFIITAQGYTTPTNQVKILPMPKPWYAVMALTCHISNPVDMDMKFPFCNQLAQLPDTELDLSVFPNVPVLTQDENNLITSIFEKIAWNIVSSIWLEKTIDNFCNEDNVTYCQIDIKNINERITLTDQTYSIPSCQLVETIINDIIYEVLHELFELGVVHRDGEILDLRRCCSKRISNDHEVDDLQIKERQSTVSQKIKTPYGW